MAIGCEHVHRLELRKSLKFLGSCGHVASVPKAPFISYSRISYFGHACPKLNFVLIYFEIYFWTWTPKIRNTGITDKWGFQHPYFVATATQNVVAQF